MNGAASKRGRSGLGPQGTLRRLSHLCDDSTNHLAAPTTRRSRQRSRLQPPRPPSIRSKAGAEASLCSWGPAGLLHIKAQHQSQSRPVLRPQTQSLTTRVHPPLPARETAPGHFQILKPGSSRKKGQFEAISRFSLSGPSAGVFVSTLAS